MKHSEKLRIARQKYPYYQGDFLDYLCNGISPNYVGTWILNGIDNDMHNLLIS